MAEIQTPTRTCRSLRKLFLKIRALLVAEWVESHKDRPNGDPKAKMLAEEGIHHLLRDLVQFIDEGDE